MEAIWQTIRQHFGFQTTGAHFIDFSDIHLEPDERPEDLYQRIMAFVGDSLLHSNGLSHHGEALSEDEELSPTLENFVVLMWLKLINPNLPRLVKQRYGTELRSRTLASIKPEISQALPSLLEELRAADDAKILRTAVASDRRRPTSSRNSNYKTPSRKACPLCQQAGRSEIHHFLSECEFLPANDKRYLMRARQIISILDEDPTSDTDTEPSPSSEPSADCLPSGIVSYRVQTRQSPYMDVFLSHHVVRLTIDSGANGNMIRHSTARRLGAPITSTSQSVHQADGSSPLQVVGETRLRFLRDNQEFVFEGLVVENLDVEV